MAIKILKSREPFYDTDALAFISAATITNNIQIMAINDLVTDLKGFNLWSKMIALYPFVGGNANSHKYNLKDPRDLDAAYRLSFSGGWIHSSTGALPNGTNGYADTFLIPNNVLSLNSTHVSYYSRTIGAALNNRAEMGTGNASGSFLFLSFYFSSAYIFDVNQTSDSVISNPSVTTHGFLCASRTGTNALRGVRNDTTLINTTTISTSMSNNSVVIGAWNSNGTKTGFSTKECAFASIGSGLTATDTTNLYTAVQKYESYLNRQV